jgi:hypothetical protein
MMHGREKSDLTVVATKLPNKAVTTSAPREHYSIPRKAPRLSSKLHSVPPHGTAWSCDDLAIDLLTRTVHSDK